MFVCLRQMLLGIVHIVDYSVCRNGMLYQYDEKKDEKSKPRLSVSLR